MNRGGLNRGGLNRGQCLARQGHVESAESTVVTNHLQIDVGRLPRHERRGEECPDSRLLAVPQRDGEIGVGQKLISLAHVIVRRRDDIETLRAIRRTIGHLGEIRRDQCADAIRPEHLVDSVGRRCFGPHGRWRGEAVEHPLRRCSRRDRCGKRQLLRLLNPRICRRWRNRHLPLIRLLLIRLLLGQTLILWSELVLGTRLLLLKLKLLPLQLLLLKLLLLELLLELLLLELLLLKLLLLKLLLLELLLDLLLHLLGRNLRLRRSLLKLLISCLLLDERTVIVPPVVLLRALLN